MSYGLPAAPAHDVFVSYATEDQAVADRLVAALRQRDIDVWISSRDIDRGVQWVRAIEDALTSCRTFAVLVTRAALKSRWVEYERNMATALALEDGSTLRIVPLLFEEVALPTTIGAFQGIDFMADFETALASLLHAIEEARPASGNERSTAAPIRESSEREVRHLAHLIESEKRKQRDLTIIRYTSLALGLILGGLLVSRGFVTSALEATAMTAVLMGITGLLGWGLTSTRMARSQHLVATCELLRDGLSDCGGRQDAACLEYRARFWTIQERMAG